MKQILSTEMTRIKLMMKGWILVCYAYFTYLFHLLKVFPYITTDYRFNKSFVDHLPKQSTQWPRMGKEGTGKGELCNFHWMFPYEIRSQ